MQTPPNLNQEDKSISMSSTSKKSGGGQHGHQNQGRAQSGNGQGGGRNQGNGVQNRGGNNHRGNGNNQRPWGVKGKQEVRHSRHLSVKTPPHEHISPFTGIEVYARLVKGTNIGFRNVGERNGLLFGELNTDPEQEPVELFVKIDDASPALQGGRIIVFTRGRDAEIEVHASNHRRGRSTYRQTVRISRGHGGRQVSVDQSTNNIYVAFVTSAGVFIKALALVHQEGRFWLLCQQQYMVVAYAKEGKVVLPGFFEKHGGLPTFPELEEVRSFYDELTQEQIVELKLEDVGSYKPEALELDTLADDELIVKLWTLRRGNGVGVLRDGREVSIFWKDVLGDEPKALRTGQVLRFRSLERISDEQQRNRKTALRWDARGLELLR